ncbi:transcriptional regulator [Jejubacter calystegiae]|uniref:Transcriptional regulator n=1 Tax=Jejubacter calystegiae TaxID=2579935 RepID=A0A4P8YDE8_9ENTR|nr:ogr/Delta-like zinc finger family protein [Jejubacter calystegiae]QCT18511.1 transcriptional regulator [Jejubacter calystegiae]
MMNCPKCGSAAHTRSSYQVSNTTKERYNQCQNINCGCTFKSLETVAGIISEPHIIQSVPPHPGRSGQVSMPWF